MQCLAEVLSLSGMLVSWSDGLSLVRPNRVHTCHILDLEQIHGDYEWQHCMALEAFQMIVVALASSLVLVLSDMHNTHAKIQG